MVSRFYNVLYAENLSDAKDLFHHCGHLSFKIYCINLKTTKIELITNLASAEIFYKEE